MREEVGGEHGVVFLDVLDGFGDADGDAHPHELGAFGEGPGGPVLEHVGAHDDDEPGGFEEAVAFAGGALGQEVGELIAVGRDEFDVVVRDGVGPDALDDVLEGGGGGEADDEKVEVARDVFVSDVVGGEVHGVARCGGGERVDVLRLVRLVARFALDFIGGDAGAVASAFDAFGYAIHGGAALGFSGAGCRAEIMYSSRLFGDPYGSMPCAELK